MYERKVKNGVTYYIYTSKMRNAWKYLKNTSVHSFSDM